jgi:hypothetical protein
MFFHVNFGFSFCEGFVFCYLILVLNLIQVIPCYAKNKVNMIYKRRPIMIAQCTITEQTYNFDILKKETETLIMGLAWRRF